MKGLSLVESLLLRLLLLSASAVKRIQSRDDFIFHERVLGKLFDQPFILALYPHARLEVIF